MELKNTMELNNKTLLIAGVIIIAVIAIYYNNNELGAVALGGLVGYLSKDPNTTTTEDVMQNDKEY